MADQERVRRLGVVPIPFAGESFLSWVDTLAATLRLSRAATLQELRLPGWATFRRLQFIWALLGRWGRKGRNEPYGGQSVWVPDAGDPGNPFRGRESCPRPTTCLRTLRPRMHRRPHRAYDPDWTSASHGRGEKASATAGGRGLYLSDVA